MNVAPYEGVWIETHGAEHLHVHVAVAPYEGAWIETKHITNTVAVEFDRHISLRC